MQNMISTESAFADHTPLGTSRKIVIDPKDRREALEFPLQERELILTFDDGPAPPCTELILDSLAREQVKATFFVVGCRAARFADVLQRAAREGHTIGTHTQYHQCIPLLAVDAQQKEIADGIDSAIRALGADNALSPFFRFPYLQASADMKVYLASRGIADWSVDIDTEDWMNTSADAFVALALKRIEQRRKGIVLMHDIEPKTALGLPILLRELKRHNFSIVHTVPAYPCAA
jgi:peptidoglycan-N-acetylglucosamine deacetylase